MKYSYNWLKEYLKTDKSVEQIGEDLVSLGSDVDEISSFPQIDEKIIAVKVTKIEPHPNADRLKLPTISDGEKEIQIVCGAPNIEVDQICCFAQVGAKVRDFEIEEAEIRGVKSPGMLLSPRELELSEDHRGIHILPEDTRLGAKVKDILGGDSVLDLEITPNRGDLLSHFGLARDLSAKYGEKLEKPELKAESSEGNNGLKIEIHSDKCSLYMARVIKNVKIAPSPAWLADKLLAVGAKPINNVVDVTNYIMLDLGHPLHAFDKAKIEGNQIIVKEIDTEMDVMTLDGVARAVLPEMLCIWDQNRPIAVAGVMGLGNSEVDKKTTDIVLEAAVFDRKSIRKTAKLLNLRSEASARFERGIDDAGTEYVINKAASMIAEIAGGEVVGEIISDGAIAETESIKIDYDRINSYAGLNLENEKIDQILKDLGFKVEAGEATIPSWRHDIEIWQDLAEEIYRINGIDKIKQDALPEIQKPAPSDYYKKEAIKDYLVELGLDETISYTFLSEADVAAAKIDTSDLLELANPVQEENRYLRNSLIPGLLKAVAKNPSFDDIEIFEIGSVFSQSEEWFSLGLVTSGKSARKVTKVVEQLCGKFGFDRNAFSIYEIPQDDLKRFKIKKPSVSIAQADVRELIKVGNFSDLDLKIKQELNDYRPISKYPPVKRDLAFLIKKEIPSLEIRNLILEITAKAVLVELFDEFESDKLGVGMKSVAFHVWLEDIDKTLSDSEADEQISKIISVLKEKFGAEIRS
jgi:phenylalanyl-tRNA synthetase beta chain